MQIHTAVKRLGFHYFPDTTHYREEELAQWLPRLQHLNASWITLVAHPLRAIPEPFIKGLLANNITPVVHIWAGLESRIEPRSMQVLLDSYAQWGIRYLALFDRPNIRLSWHTAAWSQTELVERFLDIYLPLAQATLNAGIIPVFPPLEPGGDYWDTAFLKAALRGLIRRGNTQLSEKLAIGAYAWTNARTLNWGAGGPDVWPASRPYCTPEGSEDQQGFHIFDWYLAIARTILGHSLPIFLLGAGCRMQDASSLQSALEMPELHAQINLILAQWLNATVESEIPLGLKSIPNEVSACNFWLLSASQGTPESMDAWFPENRRPLPAVGSFLANNSQASKTTVDNIGKYFGQRLGHYLLIPEKSWRDKDWIYQATKGFIERQFLTTGYSWLEAQSFRRVTIVGAEKWLGEECFQQLSYSGCLIEEVYGDGIILASKLNNL